MTTTKTAVEIDGRKITLTNLDKVLYPQANFTKAEVIDYYTRVSSYVLPHLRDRPVTLKRFPNGINAEFFYEKDAPKFTPSWIRTYPVPRRAGGPDIRYILINDLSTLIWLANAANLEIHPFLHRVPRIDQPTAMVFDLDPGPGADIRTCAEVAFLLRTLLDKINLNSFPKVSGSKGVQVYVPVNQGYQYSVVGPFAKTIARLLEQQHPRLVVAKMDKTLRRRKVFIDWSQNSDFKTTVGVYSLRANSALPYVSLPVEWDELTEAFEAKEKDALCFSPAEALRRLQRVGDLFKPLLQLKQNLPPEVVSQATHEENEPALKPYRAKQYFDKSQEPSGAVPRRSSQGSARRFVIQKHAASHLHYDFRLEMGGVLKSWAVPKGPPYSTAEKRLAMGTEDHPLEYLDFEGVIPKGQYGGGTVMIWDIGTYEIVEGNYYRGYLRFYLTGKKLKGEWELTKERTGDRNKWYWRKTETDIQAITPKADDQSALSRRTMQQIARAADRAWQSNRASGEPINRRRIVHHHVDSPIPESLESLPEGEVGFIHPMLVQLVSRLPEGPKWQYEIKLDGYRSIIVKKGNVVTVFSRNGRRMNVRFAKIASSFEALPTQTVLDGELVALDAQGRPSFNKLQNAKRNDDGTLYFYVFDALIYLKKDLRRLPLSERRGILEKIAEGLPEPIRLSPIFEGPPEDIVHAARQQRLEGVVAKRADSVYRPGVRCDSWVKIKTSRGQELVIGGYLPGPHTFESLLVGYYDDDKLLFLGKVRNGFTPAVRRDVARKFVGLEIAVCPFVNLPERPNARRGKALTNQVMHECRWLSPQLVAQVAFTDWTKANHLRHALFLGLREDKDPLEVKKESST